MAKAPRRGGSDRDPKKQRPRAAKPVRPPAAKPVKPPAAKPVRPAAAKPVKPPAAKPVRPAAAKPVRPPAAKPVKPPAAKPVRPAAAQPVKPAGAKAARPPAAPPVNRGSGSGGGRGGSSRRAREEDLSGRGGSRRSGASSGGMSLATKAGLLSALATFAAIGLTLFLAKSGDAKGAKDTAMTEFGQMAAAAMGGGDTAWWTGATSKQTYDSSWIRKQLGSLFGDDGTEFYDSNVQSITAPGDLGEMSEFERNNLRERKTAFDAALERIDGGGSNDEGGAGVAQRRLGTVYNRLPKSADNRFRVLAAWLGAPSTGGRLGKILVGTPAAKNVNAQVDLYGGTRDGFGDMPGEVTMSGKTYPVRIFTANAGSATLGGERLVGYAAVYETKPASSGASGLGLVMLLLGPALVGFVTASVAGKFGKGIKSLAREIERLGSSGDSTREIRAEGAEASQLARSVERMVSNLELRSKHDGADLDQVVSREQQVAEEIHGALISKNPPRLKDYEVETLFKPGFEIGGDHFEYFRIDDDHLGIILLDTNVRGIAAALVMASTKAYVRSAAPGVLSPAAVLRDVNRNLTGDLPPGRHVTALYVVLNMALGTATVASAGHLPLLVYRHAAGKMAKVNPEGLALGLDTGPVFEGALQEGDIPVGVGDRIVLYTDGALRVQNDVGEEYGESRFYQSVSSEAPKNSQAFVNFVGGAIDRFYLATPQSDDITISTIKRLR